MPSSEHSSTPPFLRLGVLAAIRLLPPTCLFLTFPLALVRPVHTGFPLLFHVALPTQIWLGLLALAFLLFCPLTPVLQRHAQPPVRGRPFNWNAAARLGSATILAVIGLSAVRGGSFRADSVVFSASFFLIPAYFALCPRSFLPRRMAWVLAALWTVQAGHGLWQFAAGSEVVGLAGNRNWMAALLLALSPWPLLVLGEYMAPNRGRPARFAPILAMLGTVAVSLLVGVLLWQCASRAAWLVLGAYVLAFLVLPRFSKPGRLLFLLGVGAIAVAAVGLSGDWLREQWRRDIRPPLWQQTARLILDHPLLGVGPGNFRRAYELYKSPAQRARPDVAPVTEHPHNEVLNLAATLGVPLALTWVALAFLPLLRRPRDRFHGGLHFTASVVVGCAMFDKTLVQSPSSILGLLCLGLLWRRLLHRRFRPGTAGPLARGLFTLAVPAAIGAGVFWGVRSAGTGWLFRDAYLSELQRDYAGAFAAYRAASRLDPDNIRTHFLAGDVAVNKLRDPRLALPRLRQAYRMDPNFAHVNRDIGLTLGLMGRNADALAFFEREVALYPFDPTAYRNLYVCCLGTGAFDRARNALHGWSAAVVHRLSQKLGRNELRAVAVRWLMAVRRGDARTAVASAQRLLTASAATGAEPAFYRMCKESGLSRNLAVADFGEADAARWHALSRARTVVRRNALETVPALLDFVSRPLPSGPPSPLAKQQPLTENEAYQLLGLSRQAGMATAVTRSPKDRTLEYLLIHDGEKAWLLRPATGAWFCGTSFSELLASVQKPQATKTAGKHTTTRKVLILASPLDFCLRTQVLGRVLQLTLGAAAPVFGDSPSLRRQTWLDLLGAAPRETRPFERTDFDLMMFADFRKQWRITSRPVKILAPSRPTASRAPSRGPPGRR
ncbi:MAG: hypothetical protein GXP31_11280 [Kiritimatiellaeota bacterium]|nr:hypothetical protein [Kiritimatiellota bacterium]